MGVLREDTEQKYSTNSVGGNLRARARAGTHQQMGNGTGSQTLVFLSHSQCLIIWTHAVIVTSLVKERKAAITA